jgi:O-acetyl-ADP-ribose deacetylase (regulator of RNase III)
LTKEALFGGPLVYARLISVESLDLHLVDPSVPIYDALKEAFKGTEVRVHFDYFEELDDGGLENAVMVSAANSFGLMDGGIDGAITRYFGPQLMVRVQERIRRDYWGEQPVGTSFIIEAWNPKASSDPSLISGYRWLAHTPTMRVPADIFHTDNVYLAMKAMLKAVADYNNETIFRSAGYDQFWGNDGPPVPQQRREDEQIKHVVCPGLGTGVGAMPPEEAARQMRLAFDNFHHVPDVLDWQYASKVQSDVNGPPGLLSIHSTRMRI